MIRLRFRAGINFLFGVLLSLLLIPASGADLALDIHYAPNLEHADVALIDQAERNIDIAAYVLTDWPRKHPTLSNLPKSAC